MKIQMMFLVMIPCLMALGCGSVESEPESAVSPRGEQVEPCDPEDCVPLGAQLQGDCPEGTELMSGAECVDADGVCIWELWEECVDIGGGDPPPPVNPPPPPSEGPPRPIRPG